MILSALASTWVTTEEWSEEMQSSLSDSYTVIDADEDAGNSALLGASLLNGLVIIAVICGVTFFVVILLKYRCMKVLYAYLVFAFVSLLFFVASEFFRVAIEAFSLQRVDKFTYWCSLYNFALVGTISIFLPQGVPIWLTHSSLILASVLVAWQLSQFDPWTAWILLILLCVYDLLAVLTPCGPLKVLIDIMQKDDAPAMPSGLLFEARNRSSARPSVATNTSTSVGQSQSQDTVTSNDNSRKSKEARPSRESDEHLQEMPDPSHKGISRHLDRYEDCEEETVEEESRSTRLGTFEEKKVEMDDPGKLSSKCEAKSPVYHDQDGYEVERSDASTGSHGAESSHTHKYTDSTSITETRMNVSETRTTLSTNFQNGRVVQIPLALARLYKLPLENDPNPIWRRSRRQNDQEEPSCAQFSVEQLQSLVNAIVPHNGGVIEPHPKQREGQAIRYKVIDAKGNLRRIIFVGQDDGGVFEDRSHEERCEAEEKGASRPENDRIRLGLGDFVFYSVLVALASDYSFSCFAAAFITILNGLLATLVILGMMKRALPALPISIVAAIVTYVLTRIFVQDWIEEVHIQATYV